MECLLEAMRIRLSIIQGNQYPRRLLIQVAQAAINCRRTLVFSCGSFFSAGSVHAV
jgi:hypothetical protein